MSEPSAPLAVADYIVIVGFFVVMLAVGFYFAGQMRSIRDFFGGGNRVPWWLSGASFYMSSFSAFAFVAYSELAYLYGWVSVTLYWVTVPASVIGAYWFAARWRRAARTSPLEYIEERYNCALRQLLALLGIPVKVIDDGLKLFAIGMLVSVGLDFPLMWAVTLSGVIILIYTFLGGLWAVLVTDFIQFVVMLAAVVVLLPLAFQKAGGLQAFYDATPDGFFALTTDDRGWVYLGGWFVLITLNYSTSWSLVQRYYSVATDSDARKVGYMVAVLNVIGPPLLFAPAMAAHVFMPDVVDTKSVYALLCREVLPVGMVGMVVAAMFSATMSMLSSDYNSVASVLTNDFYKRLFGQRASERSLVMVARFTTLLVGLIALGVAYMIVRADGDDELFGVMVKVFSIFLPPIAIPMILGLINRRVSTWGAMAGLLTGMAAGLLAYKLGQTESYAYFSNVQIMTLTTCSTTVFALGLVSWLKPSNAEERKRIEAFFSRLEQSEEMAVETTPSKDPTKESVGSPLPAIGYSILALGLLLPLAVLFSGLPEGSGISVGVGLTLVLVGGGCLLLARREQRSIANGE